MILILIETATRKYARYSGRTRVAEYQFEEHLSPYWVEMLRVRPEEIFLEEPPEPDSA